MGIGGLFVVIGRHASNVGAVTQQAGWFSPNNGGSWGGAQQVDTLKGGIFFSETNGAPTNSFSNSSNPANNYQHNSNVRFNVYATCSGLRLEYVNSANDTAPSGRTHVAITIAAGIRMPDNSFHQITFDGGSTTKTLAVGARAVSDALSSAVIFVPGQNYYVRTRLTITAVSGNSYPLNYITDASDEGAEFGNAASTDKTTSGSITSSLTRAHTATAVLADNIPQGPIPNVLVIGDSLEVGSSETSLSAVCSRNRGYVGKALSGRVPHYRICVGGESWSEFLADNTERLAAFSTGGFSHALIGGMRNDLQEGRTEAQIKTDASTVYDLCNAQGIRVVACTSPPYLTTAPGNDFTSEANQTRSALTTSGVLRDEIRRNLTTWQLAGADGKVWRGINTGAAVESTTSIGKWQAPGGVAYSFDGLHAREAGYQAMADALSPSNFTV